MYLWGVWRLGAAKGVQGWGGGGAGQGGVGLHEARG